MKTNLALSLLFVGMLIGTYFLIELPQRQQSSQANLLSEQHLGPLLGIEGKNFFLEKREKQFWVRSANYLASAILLEHFLSTLEKIRLRREIPLGSTPEEKKNFFSDDGPWLTFHFADGQKQFLLGHKLHHSTEFYLSVKEGVQERWMIVDVEIPLEGVYDQEQARRSDEKYQKVLSLVGLTNEQWLEMRLLSDQKRQIRQVQVENWRNRPFLLDLEAWTLSPNPVPAAPINRQHFLVYGEQLQKLQAEKIFLEGELGQLQEVTAQLGLAFAGGEEEKWHLGKKFRNQYGYFLWARGNVYQLSASAVVPFFASAQDFLEKRIFTELPTQVQLLFPGQSPINFPVASANAAQQQLFRYLGQSADYLSAGDKTLAFAAGQGPWLEMVVGVEKLQVFFQENELVIHAPARRINFHFWVAKDGPIGLNFSDYGPRQGGN